jgi:hypothetical protein
MSGIKDKVDELKHSGKDKGKKKKHEQKMVDL